MFCLKAVLGATRGLQRLHRVSVGTSVSFVHHELRRPPAANFVRALSSYLAEFHQHITQTNLHVPARPRAPSDTERIIQKRK